MGPIPPLLLCAQHHSRRRGCSTNPVGRQHEGSSPSQTQGHPDLCGVRTIPLQLRAVPALPAALGDPFGALGGAWLSWDLGSLLPSPCWVLGDGSIPALGMPQALGLGHIPSPGCVPSWQHIPCGCSSLGGLPLIPGAAPRPGWVGSGCLRSQPSPKGCDVATFGAALLSPALQGTIPLSPVQQCFAPHADRLSGKEQLSHFLGGWGGFGDQQLWGSPMGGSRECHGCLPQWGHPCGHPESPSSLVSSPAPFFGGCRGATTAVECLARSPGDPKDTPQCYHSSSGEALSNKEGTWCPLGGKWSCWSK